MHDANIPPTLLASQPDLEALVAGLAQAQVVALDTEFVRESTYYAQLCLLQVATAGHIACVDPLAGIELEEFWKVVLRASPLTLMHAGRQDLELIWQHTGRLPEVLFDTQVAAALLGHPAQIGYAGLVQRLLDIVLDKSHARTDWSRRPLPQDKLAYAADDVRYLLEVHERLDAELHARGRRAWAQEDCAALLNPALYQNPPEEAWHRVKGLRRLQGRARHAARALAAWRETTAEWLDRPRRWVLSDEQLLALAAALPTDAQAIGEVAGLPAGLVRRRGEELLAVLAQVPDTVADEIDPLPLSDEEKSRLARLSALTRKVADELGIETEVLATRAELTAAARGAREGRVFAGWRGEVLGERLLETME